MRSAYGFIVTESESVFIIILPSASDSLVFSAVHKIWHVGSIPELRGIDREGLVDFTRWDKIYNSGGSSGGRSGGRSGGSS